MGRINKKLAKKAAASNVAAQKQSLKDRSKEDSDLNSLLMLKKPASSGIMKKKDRIKAKREFLETKLKKAELAKVELKAQKKREKVAIIGDTKPLSDTLAMLDKVLQEDEEQKLNRDEKKTGKSRESKGTKKLRQRKKQFNQDVALFAQIKKHDVFKEDPFGIIGTHIENKVLSEAMDGD